MKNLTRILFDYFNKSPNKNIINLLHTGVSDKTITYQDLYQGSSVYVRELINQGIQPGEVVILILQHGIELIYSYFGCIMHGCIPSIMPFLTEKLQPERYRSDLISLLSITKPAAIITYDDFEKEIIPAIKPDSSVRKIIITNNVTDSFQSNNLEFGGLHRYPNDIVLLQHSSGTTGLQKGVALSHQAIIYQINSYAEALNLSRDDVIVSWLPLYHDMGLIACFIMPILLGIELVIMSPFEWVRAPIKLLEAISKFGGTLCWLPNFAYNFCANKIREKQLEGINLSTLRAVINCSEPVKWESHQNFISKFSAYGLKENALATCYAMAENVFAVTQGGIKSKLLIDKIDQYVYQTKGIAQPCGSNSQSIMMVSNGKCISGSQFRIVTDKGETLTDRRIGEILIKSNCMLTGYFNRPDETEKSIVDGWFKTGDLGYSVDGELFVSGRKKDLIIVGGKNIYPQDLENLAMEVRGVHRGRVVAFGIYNEEIGTEDVVIVAEIDESDYEIKELIAEKIREKVTQGSAIALRHVLIVHPRWLIKTSSGKIARSANREKFIKHQKNVKINK